MPLSDGIAPPDRTRQIEDLFLNIGGQQVQVHDLSDAGARERNSVGKETVSDTVFSGSAKDRTVNTPLNANELEALVRALGKCRPCGAERWTHRMISRLR